MHGNLGEKVEIDLAASVGEGSKTNPCPIPDLILSFHEAVSGRPDG